MDPSPAANFISHSSKIHMFAGSSSYADPDIMEVTGWSSSNPKRKREQVVPHDVIEIDGDDDPDGVVIIGESSANQNKNKSIFGYSIDWQKKGKDALASDITGPSSSNPNPIPTKLDPLSNALKPSMIGPNPSLQDFNFADYEYFEDDDFYDFDEDYENYDFDSGFGESENNFNLAAKFDHLDLPTGIEAQAPWLQKHSVKFEQASSSKGKQAKVVSDEIDLKYGSFKQFDTVSDCSDHYYLRPEQQRSPHSIKKLHMHGGSFPQPKFGQIGSNSKSLPGPPPGKFEFQPSKVWTKRIQHEWKLLEKHLPETIFVRVYEDRMDLLRAVIIGPAGTPYHDGLFFFDVYFPPSYPQVPPMVHYHSGGLRLNPNLYACGKVCLSLLNTWSGSGCEKWNPANSTMLQVLVSIQALVLNAKPYFNEPGYVTQANTPYGEKSSLDYNEEAFLLSCKTMLYSLRRPPKHFEDFVSGHFRNWGRAILVACKAYMDGAQVGCVVGDGVQDVDEGDTSCSPHFKSSLRKLFDDLLMDFTIKGADCDSFIAQNANRSSANNSRNNNNNARSADMLTLRL